MLNPTHPPHAKLLHSHRVGEFLVEFHGWLAGEDQTQERWEATVRMVDDRTPSVVAEGVIVAAENGSRTLRVRVFNALAVAVGGIRAVEGWIAKAQRTIDENPGGGKQLTLF